MNTTSSPTPSSGPVRVFVGDHETENLAFRVLEYSIRHHTNLSVEMRTIDSSLAPSPKDDRVLPYTNFFTVVSPFQKEPVTRAARSKWNRMNDRNLLLSGEPPEPVFTHDDYLQIPNLHGGHIRCNRVLYQLQCGF